MKTLISVLLISLTASSSWPQEVESYDMSVNIDVHKKTINVNGSLKVDFQHRDTLSLVLWKNSAIHYVALEGVPLSYNFDTTSRSPMMYIPNGRKLMIIKSVQEIDGQSVSFGYDCDMKDLNGWAKSFNDDWIELNFYSAWFPVCPSGGDFISRITISIDSEYVVSGSGIVSGENGRWEMVQPWHGFDNVIVAAPNLEKKILRTGSANIETDYSDFPDSAADSVISECSYALSFYEKLFGVKDSAYLKFVVAPFEQGGGYSRKNFVRMGTKQFNIYTRVGVGHELAHFWWSNANTTTWEDWLNEAFAEYSMLVYLRERLGMGFFLERINEYKKDVLKTPPIWGIDRNVPEAYVVLYEKGALVLCEFEAKVGRDKFFSFLNEVSDRRIRTTNDLLDLVEVEFSKEVRVWLKNELQTR